MTRWVQNKSGVLIPRWEAGFIQPGIGLMNKKQGGGGGGDPYFSYVRSLIHFDGVSGATAFTDVVSSNMWTRRNYSTSGSAALSSDQARFGTTSLRKTGVDYYYDTSSNLTTGTGAGPHTMECWAWIDALDGPQYNRHILLSQEFGGGSSDQFLSIGMQPGQQGLLTFFDHTSTIAQSTLPPVSVAAWHYFAFDFDGAFIRLFVDGNLAAKVARAYGWRTTANSFKLGTAIVSGYQQYRTGMNGYLDEFRLTVGVSRYGSDAGFSVPTGPFPNHA